MSQKTGYWRRLWAALRGRDAAAGAIERPDDPVELKATVASLRLDLEERDERIAAMRAEYERLEASKQQSTAAAGQEELIAFLKKLSAPLSNITVLRAAAEAGEPVQVGDLLDLTASLEKVVTRAGLEPIGHPGQATHFDSAAHQRMSGGSVRDGATVTIEVPGYRFGKRVLQKALVHVEGNKNGENRN